YRVGTGPVMVQGVSGADQVTFGGADSLTFNGTTYTYAAGSVSGIRIRSHDGDDALNLTGATAAALLMGGAGNDSLIGGAGNDLLDGGTGNDCLIGAGGNDSLVGGSGDDMYQFAPNTPLGSDTITEGAGAGTDLIDFSQATTAVILDVSLTTAQVVNAQLTLTLSAGDGIENLIGGSGADALTGNGLTNLIIGAAGNDTVLGGAGRDLVVGGSGSDTVRGGTDDDIVIGGTMSYYNEATRVLNQVAITAILAEWNRTDSDYTTRISRLKNGGGLNGTYKLNSTTVVLDDGAVDILYGDAGLDWFLGALFSSTSPDTFAGVGNGGKESIN
ncbi:MAG: calcium-binding protein, partial [Planctomycetales bacterium]